MFLFLALSLSLSVSFCRLFAFRCGVVWCGLGAPPLLPSGERHKQEEMGWTGVLPAGPCSTPCSTTLRPQPSLSSPPPPPFLVLPGRVKLTRTLWWCAWWFVAWERNEKRLQAMGLSRPCRPGRRMLPTAPHSAAAAAAAAFAASASAFASAFASASASASAASAWYSWLHAHPRAVGCNHTAAFATAEPDRETARRTWWRSIRCFQLC